MLICHNIGVVGMNVIALRTLRDFCRKHPDALAAMEEWHDILSRSEVSNFAEVKAIFGSADWVGPDYVIFDIKGNHYRIVTRVDFQWKTFWIKAVLTHAEYDRWKP